MASVGFQFGIVCLAQVDVGRIVSVAPLAFAGNHFPPDAHVLAGLYPGCIFQLAGLVQVQRDARSEDVAGVVADNDRTPRRAAGRLHVSLVAIGIGRKPGGKDKVLVVQVEVHTRIVHQSGFVQVDVQAVVTLQHQGRLYAGGREAGLRQVAGDGPGHQAAYLAQAAACVVILLRVIVTGNPPGGVVAGHGKLRTFVGNDEVAQVTLLRKLVTEAQGVVEYTETDVHQPFGRGLLQFHQQFFVMVAYFVLFAPHGFPRLVFLALRCFHQPEIIYQGRAVLQPEAQPAGFDHILAFILQRIAGRSSFGQFETEGQVSVGRRDRLYCAFLCLCQ